MQRGFAPILILVGILILGLVAGGVYYSWTGKSANPIPPPTPVVTSVSQPSSASQATPIPSPDSDETANWKTYTDSTLVASFKYPSNWTLNSGRYGISTPTIKDDWYIDVSDPNYGDSTCRGDCPVFNVTVSVYNNDQNLDLASYIKKDFNSITGGAGNFSQVKLENTILANGLSFTKVTGFPGGNYYSLYALHNKRVYIIGVGAGVNGMRDDINSAKVKQNLAIFDQILSTFKFTQ